MIDIQEIELYNFISFNGQHKFKIKNRNILLILGNVDGIRANGAGKSALLNAIPWCLFSRIPGYDNPSDKVINNKSTNGCYVRIKTTDGFEITRFRKYDGKNDVSIKKNNEDLSLMTPSETQEEINKIFKTSYETFITSMFLSSREKSFLELSNNKRFSIIADLLDINRIDIYEKKAKKILASKLEEIEELKKEMGEIEHNINSYEREIQYIQESSSKNQDIREQEINALESRKLELEEFIKHSPTIEELNALLEQHNKHKKIDTLKEEIKTIDAKINMLERSVDEEYNIEELKERYEQYEQYEKLKSEKEKLLTIIDIKKQEIKKIQKEYKEMRSLSGVCPLCQQDINEDHKVKINNEFKNKIDSQIDELQQIVDQYKSIKIIKVERPFISIERAKEYNEKRKKTVEEIKRNTIEKQQKGEILTDIAPSNLEKPEIPKENITTLIAKIEINSDSIKDINKRINTIKATIKSENEKSQIDIRQYREDIDKLTNCLKESSNTLLQEKNLLAHHSVLYSIYHDKDKLRRFIISIFIKEFNSKLKKYLELFEWNTSISFDEGLNISDSRLFSSGEKRRIDLAISLSLLQSKFLMYGPQSNFLVLDEIDNGLDSDGIEKLILAISDIIDNNSIDSIFVLTHKSDIKDYVDNRITIDNYNGDSIVRDSNL